MISEQEKAKRYSAIKNRLALSEPLFLLILLAAIQTTGISAWIKGVSCSLSPVWYVQTAIYGIIFALLYYLLTFGFGFYRSYVLEHNFGLSNQGLHSWLKDEAKRGLLALIVFIIYIEFFYFAVRNSTGLWWLLLASGWIFFTVVLAKLFPVLILPLFFKYEDVADNDLRMRLIGLAQKCGVKILDVFKIKLGSKTKKANAALAGIGKTRRVLLGDTLLDNYTKDEIEAVFAHELAHHRLGHIWKMLSAGGLGICVVFYALNRLSPVLLETAGAKGLGDISAFPFLLFAISFLSLIISPLEKGLSRKLERSADYFALKITGLPGAFISCMEKLARQNLADPSPGRLIEIMLYDHPPISKRVRMAEGFKKKIEKEGVL